MKLLERCFGYRQWDHAWIQVTTSRNYGASFCGYTLNKLFTIPIGIDMIWISLHDRSSPNRIRVKIYSRLNGKVLVVWGNVGESGERFYRSSPLWDRYLRPYVGRTLYVQIEY